MTQPKGRTRPSRRMFSLVSVALLAPLANAVGCGGTTPKAPPVVAPAGSAKASAKGSKSMDPPGLTGIVTGSYLVPELTQDRGVIFRDEGHKKVLVDRMRLIVHENGSMERASELLPSSYAAATELPSRLGGGYLFSSSSGGHTQLWRAASWLGRLSPLTRVTPPAQEIVAGFDRLYVRLQSSNRLVAIDPESGALTSLGPLPPSVSYGALAFADGWRAVVDTDLRGPLVTFDAGTTWRALNLGARAGTISAITGDPMVFVPGGKYVIDATGNVRFHPDPPRKHKSDKDDEDDAVLRRPPGPLGKKPLRAALEDGFPDGGRSAIVARGGALARVSLRDGSIARITEEAYKDRDASCHAVRLGKGWGFVCGEHDGATSVMEFVPPFSLKEVWRFEKPRFIAPSGNGALVLRGACTDEPFAAQTTGGRTYCIRTIDGQTKQIRVTGDLGAERVIALADGRVVVLVPPRRQAGQITVLRGAAVESTAALKLPKNPFDSAKMAKRGLWLEGFEEREPGVIGGWVDAGGAVVGVQIKLDGTVKLGEMRSDPNGAVLSGRFGLSMGDDGEAAESTDGGMTWSSFDVPDHDIDSPPRTRACGPLGCALASWLRVGWGQPLVKDDFATAKSPSAPYSKLKSASTVTLSCEVLGSVTPPLPPKLAAQDKTKKPIVPAYPHYSHRYYGRYGYGYGYKPQWIPFRNVDAPALGKDDAGVDTGNYSDLASLRSYAWGKKGADWTRVGKWIVRFDDPFDVTGGIRSTATTAPPWADEAAAITGIAGGMTYGLLAWQGHIDPGGSAMLGQACNGPCALYSLTDGQPPLPLRDASSKLGTYQRLLSASGNGNGSAVRIGESWFFLTQGTSYDSIALWRADLGIVRQIGMYFRPSRGYRALEAPRLVRRALGRGLGLLVTAPREQDEASSTWHVLPVDPDSGELEEPILLGRRDLEGTMPERCGRGQDGWLVVTPLETTPGIDLGKAYAPLDGIEWRLRLDPGSVCAEGISAKVEGTLVSQKKIIGKPRSVSATKVPLAATERSSGTRWVMECGPQTDPKEPVFIPPESYEVEDEEDFD